MAQTHEHLPRADWLIAAYFLLGVAVWSALIIVPDDWPSAFYLSMYGFLGLASLLAGLIAGRWKALWLVGVLWLSALTTDLLTAAGLLDRSDEYEPFPVAHVIVFWDYWFLPAMGVLLALGIVVRRRFETRRGRRVPSAV